MSRCLFVLASFGCPRPVLGLLFAAALLTGCGRSEDAAIGGTATGLGPLTLRLAAAPGPAEGGFIQALAAGYYAAEGLAVEIVVGGGAADVIGAVAAGEADFGVAPSDLVLRAAAAGEALQLVGASHQPTAEELRKDGAGAPSAVWFSARLEKPTEVRRARAFSAATIQGWLDYASGDPAPAHRWLLARDPTVSLAQLEAGRSRLLAAKRVMGPRDDWRQVGHFSEVHLRAQLAALAGAPALEAIFSPETLPPRLLRKSFRRQRPDDLEVIAIWSEGAGPSSRFFAWEDLRSHPAAFRSSSALEFAAEAYEVTGLPLADFVVAAGARGEVRLILADCTDTYQANFGSEMLGRRGAYLVLALGDQSVAEWAAAQGNPQWGPYLVTLQDFEGLLDPLNKQPWGVVRLQFRPAATPPWGAALAGAPRAAREGALIYRNTCLSCHAHDETYGGRVSNRSLAVLALHARTNRPYFERMLEAPEDTLATAAPMPAYPHYTKEEIDRLVAFLRVVGP